MAVVRVEILIFVRVIYSTAFLLGDGGGVNASGLLCVVVLVIRYWWWGWRRGGGGGGKSLCKGCSCISQRSAIFRFMMCGKGGGNGGDGCGDFNC